jgi:hypothetical protein
MAKKKPLVLTAGRVERLQSGDRLDLSRSATKNNSTGNTINAGSVLYVTGNDAELARANADSTSRVAGFAEEDSSANSTVEVTADGVMTLTTAKWDAVTGGSGGLTPGSDYFLSKDTAGQITTTAPDADGEFVSRVGHALSTTEMDVEIAQPIKL